MNKILLGRIKFLESEIKNREELIETLKKNCRIPESKKPEVLKVLKKQKKIKEYYYEKGILAFDVFLCLIEDLKNGYLLLIDYENKNEIKSKSVLSFLDKKFSSIFTKDDDYIYGIVYFDELEILKKMKKINYFDPEKEDFDDIEIYKIIFEADRFNRNNIEKAKKKFSDFRERPTLKNIHYLEYSLIRNKLIDIEKEKIEQEKDKYRYIYDVHYPNLELKIKFELDNLPFLHTLLERIDNEIRTIKSSRGTLSVVRRILDNIINNCVYDNIVALAQLTKRKLED